MYVSEKVISTVQHYSCHTRIVTNMAKLHGIDGDKIVPLCIVWIHGYTGCPNHKSGLP
jgi:hypothetical protein